MYANLMSDSESESSEEHSSSECTTDSSDDDKLEVVQCNRSRVLLPQGLCEKKEIFDEFITRSWNALGEAHHQHLRQFLPEFPENQEQEQNITVQKLLSGENFKFVSPLDNFYEHLKAGHYRPDIAKMRYLIRKAERKESLWRHRKYKERLQAELMESRKSLMRQMTQLPPGHQPQMRKQSGEPGAGSKTFYNRTKRRYFDILAGIKGKVDESGFSSDDNYPEGPPTPVSRKDKRLLNTIKNSQVLNGEKVIISTNATKSVGLDLEKNIQPDCNPYVITETVYRRMLHEHRKRKFDSIGPSDPEGLTLSEIIQRAKINYNKREKLTKTEIPPKPTKKKAKKVVAPVEVMNYSSELNFSSESDECDSLGNDLGLPPVPTLPALPCLPPINSAPPLMPAVPPSVVVPAPITPKSKPEPKKKTKRENSPKLVPPPGPPPVEPKVSSPVHVKVETVRPPPSPPPTIKLEEIKDEPPSEFMTPATLSDLDGIDMMKLPIDLHDPNIDIMEISTKVELMQDTHANFLALIRDIICSTPEHRMDMQALEERLKSWQENPITPLNDWYCLTENWANDLQSAVNFLSGNFPEQPDEFVPYIEYKAALNKYQWIGAGRDSDILLAPLFQYWLEHKSEMKPVISIKEKDDEKDSIDLELDRSMTPPPPRCPTDWQVRKADTEEIKLFREQERQRYDNPHKSFTYRCNGYESVVGPLKGIYSPSAGNTKARGHNMLSADRPNFVTILSLVRDATARLPNGEGTRAEICELLRCSQYISATAPDNVLQSVVSGALDRMHTQFDPCVKYDPKRKIWIYLHRNRTEEDFERIHQQCQGMNNKTTKKKKSPAKPKPPKADKKLPNNIVPPGGAKNNSAVLPEVQTPIVEAPKEKEPKQSSLLINNSNNQNPNNVHLVKNQLTLNNKLEVCEEVKPKTPDAPPWKQLEEISAEDKEIKQALQTITQSPTRGANLLSTNQIPLAQTQTTPHVTPVTQHQVPALQQQQQQVVQMIHPSTPTPKLAKQAPPGKSLVKIITSNAPGKSLIIPSSANTYVKQDARIITTTPGKPPLVTQQLLQSLAQQKQQLSQQQQLIRLEIPDKDKKTTNLSIPQQILQSISPQQLQNIKNVTLLRNVRQNHQGSIVLAHNDDAGTSGVDATKEETVQQPQQQQQQPIRVQPGSLTISQQIQRLQRIRHQQQHEAELQQLLIRHNKSPVVQKGAAPGTSLLGQTRVVQDINSGNKSTIGAANQGPIVAKVLTNAAGQVISVESLLAHQKQHGSLPQGATLRVSGVKGGTNIIQLGSTTQNKTSQAAVQVVGSQNNFIALANQPKLVLSSTTSTNATTTVTSSKAITKTVSKTQPLTKFPTKATQQIINAKFIAQNVDGQQKLVQPKVVIGQNQLKFANKGSKPLSIQTATASSTNSIRMVNTANLNLAHLGGKPVLLASKGGSLQNIQGQNVIIQTQANTSTSSLLAMSANNKNSASGVSNVNVINQAGQQVVLAPQLKMQPQQVLLGSSNVKNSNLIANQATNQQQIIVGSHPVRLATNSGANAQRVVLASQGQGGQLVAQQILLPAGFQGTAINIKSLQGVKVIPIAQQAKGFQGRQVFARVMNPSSIVRTATVSAAEVKQAAPTSE